VIFAPGGGAAGGAGFAFAGGAGAGLAFAGGAFGGIGVPDCLADGERAARDASSSAREA